MGRSGTPGMSTANRLASRADRKALSRQSMPGGGEVVKGALASRALEALGARAMTVDRTVIVSDGFNPSLAEDQALFAHEQHHATHSGGENSGAARDAEEVEARAIEAMVFHRAASGGYEAGYEQGANDRPSSNSWNDNSQNSQRHTAGTQGSQDKPDANQAEPDAGRGYEAMIHQGMSHADIRDDLVRRALGALDEAGQVRQDRGSEFKGWM